MITQLHIKLCSTDKICLKGLITELTQSGEYPPLSGFSSLIGIHLQNTPWIFSHEISCGWESESLDPDQQYCCWCTVMVAIVTCCSLTCRNSTTDGSSERPGKLVSCWIFSILKADTPKAHWYCLITGNIGQVSEWADLAEDVPVCCRGGGGFVWGGWPSWTRWPVEVPSNQNCPVILCLILWFCKCNC